MVLGACFCGLIGLTRLFVSFGLQKVFFISCIRQILLFSPFSGHVGCMLKIENEVMNAVFENKTVAQTEQELHTHAAEGLSAEEARARLEKNGPNALVEKKGKTRLQMFLAQLNEPMIYILFAAAAISFAAERGIGRHYRAGGGAAERHRGHGPRGQSPAGSGSFEKAIPAPPLWSSGMAKCLRYRPPSWWPATWWCWKRAARSRRICG